MSTSLSITDGRCYMNEQCTSNVIFRAIAQSRNTRNTILQWQSNSTSWRESSTQMSDQLTTTRARNTRAAQLFPSQPLNHHPPSSTVPSHVFLHVHSPSTEPANHLPRRSSRFPRVSVSCCHWRWTEHRPRTSFLALIWDTTTQVSH